MSVDTVMPPPCAVCTAFSTSPSGPFLVRNPAAPAAVARPTKAASLLAVRITTRVSG
jgi:hypothetical protein